MSASARALGRALFWIGVALCAIGVVTIGIGLYAGTWPIRRLARRSPAAARAYAIQDGLLAVGTLLSAFRSSGGRPRPPA